MGLSGFQGLRPAQGKLRPWGLRPGCGAVWRPPPGAEPSPSPPGSPAAAPQGDLLFLLDSSASVSHYEFSRVREFLGQLVAQLPLGPGALSASLVHVSSRPHAEFPFSQHRSGAAVQDAIRAAAQRMGDTNTGLALARAKEQLFAEAAGARPGVPKVLVWVTDGGSSDPVGPPMQELKDLGVTVFIVSTGRGNLLELSAAASAPAEKHLHFVDVDDLHIITQELSASIVGRWDDGVWGTPAKVREESWGGTGRTSCVWSRARGRGPALRASPGRRPPRAPPAGLWRDTGQACVNDSRGLSAAGLQAPRSSDGGCAGGMWLRGEEEERGSKPEDSAGGQHVLLSVRQGPPCLERGPGQEGPASPPQSRGRTATWL